MRPSSILLPAAAAVLLTAAALAATMVGQAPAGSQSTAGDPPSPPRAYAAPANLKVLPKDTTGQQVHDLMEEWERSLGIDCNSCHAEDLDNLGPDGRPRLNFADDSKPMKAVTRTMYTMTEEINRSYLAKIDSSGAPVTCGTCHRGHLGPEPFVTPPEKPAQPQTPPPDAERPQPQ